MSCIGLLAVILIAHQAAPQLSQNGSVPSTQNTPAVDSAPTPENTPGKKSATGAQEETGQMPLGLLIGSITLNTNESIPLAISFQITSKEVEQASDEIFSEGKAYIASFTIDQDAGPYEFDEANYSIDDGSLRHTTVPNL
jgi:hypothetical protein